MSERLGQQFVVDNRGGASGTIGTEIVAQGAAPTATRSWSSRSRTWATRTSTRSCRTTRSRDFAPVGLLRADRFADGASVAAGEDGEGIRRARPRQTRRDSVFVRRQRRHPAPVDRAAGVDDEHEMTQVNYKGGGPQAIALLAGETQVLVSAGGRRDRHNRSRAPPPARRDLAQPLGDASRMRRPSPRPACPATKCAVGRRVRAGRHAGADHRPPKRRNQQASLKLPDVAQNLSAQALDPWTSTPEEFGARLKADYDKYAKLIKLTGADDCRVVLVCSPEEQSAFRGGSVAQASRLHYKCGVCATPRCW